MAIIINIYEDNDNLRTSLVTLLELDSNIETIHAFANAMSVEIHLERFKPDVMLMDIDMPGINGVEAVKLVRKENADIPIIMFTVFDDDDNIFAAICAGANGYILKKNFDQIPHAIQDVLGGGAPISSSIAKKVLQWVASPKKMATPTWDILTPRETEILESIVKGNSYKMIASASNISVETVRSHVKNVYKKLQVNSATEAAYKYTHRQ